MKIYNIFIVLFCGISYFNIKSGCCGNDAKDTLKLELYKFNINNDSEKVFFKYIDPSENKEYREEENKDIFKENYFYVKCDNASYLDGLILMQYTNGSVDDDNKKSYKIIVFENFKKSDNLDYDKLWKKTEFSKVKFLEYEKDGVYNLNDNADEYFKNIKDKKISKILFLNENKIKQSKKDNPDGDKIDAPTSSGTPIKIQFGVSKRLLKDK